MRYRYLNKKRTSVEVQNYRQESFFFPSEIYPLSSKNLKVFEINTTERLNEEQIQEVSRISNDITAKIGYCYSNCENFISRHEELNSKLKIDCYTGWLILGNDIPIHHSWLVVEGKHVIDYSITEEDMEMNKSIAHLPIEEQRELLLSKMIENDKKKNSEKMLLGLVPSDLLYIGSKSTPNMGRILYNKAKAANPNVGYDGDIFTNPNHLQNQYYKIKVK